ncbi:hypothetical protein CEXT_793791 [Caerostris extrusa]|uniref:Uncharacterized protein n=1 Tax=Caerostris extrusa TaxID=172846 RepID=A0AAV4QFE9_CAEEX|nr:hypothetical protein CEXT_793791 [Caerostris extrusa]
MTLVEEKETQTQSKDTTAIERSLFNINRYSTEIATIAGSFWVKNVTAVNDSRRRKKDTNTNGFVYAQHKASTEQRVNLLFQDKRRSRLGC